MRIYIYIIAFILALACRQKDNLKNIIWYDNDKSFFQVNDKLVFFNDRTYKYSIKKDSIFLFSEYCDLYNVQFKYRIEDSKLTLITSNFLYTSSMNKDSVIKLHYNVFENQNKQLEVSKTCSFLYNNINDCVLEGSWYNKSINEFLIFDKQDCFIFYYDNKKEILFKNPIYSYGCIDNNIFIYKKCSCKYLEVAELKQNKILLVNGIKMKSEYLRIKNIPFDTNLNAQNITNNYIDSIVLHNTINE